ncbi:MAG: hypothetical protein ACRET4_15675 [Steroidobacteraceae bacterium]
MTTSKLTFALLAALALVAGCDKSATDAVDTAQVAPNAPKDPPQAAIVTQAELAYDAAVKKADGDRNFTISECTKLANNQAMPCMEKADQEFAAARDRAKAELDAVRL